MIPTCAFFALLLLFLAGIMFGAMLSNMPAVKVDEPEQERHGCDTCKYENVRPEDEPCRECLVDDVDRWERCESSLE